MFKIVEEKILAPQIKQIKLKAPQVAKKALPGQFVVVRPDEKSERIPLTIGDRDIEKGTITIVFQEVGATTKILGCLKKGDEILDLVGPLGNAAHIEKFGAVVGIGGGVGIPELYPVLKALKEAGNKVISIIGARSSDLLIFREEIKSCSDIYFEITDDGSSGRKGFVSDVLKELFDKGEKIDLVTAVGPLPMMKVVADLTRPFQVKTYVSLNPIMLDATGMCGVCRVTVGGERKLSCVDGPEFDAHQVDFEELSKRLQVYKPEEKIALEKCCGQNGECKCH